MIIRLFILSFLLVSDCAYAIGNIYTSDGQKDTVIIDNDGNFGVRTMTPDGIIDVTPDSPNATSYGYPMPRLTRTQIDNLAGMVEGAQVYDTTAQTPRFYDATLGQWKSIFGKDFVNVNTLADLPAPIEGVIVLENKYYRFADEGLFYVPYQLDVTNSPSLYNGQLVYLGAGSPFLISSDATGFFVNKLMTYVDGTGVNTLFDIQSTEPSFMLNEECAFVGWSDLGTIQDITAINRTANFLSFGDGLKFVDAIDVQFVTCGFRDGQNNDIDILDFSGSIDGLVILSSRFVPKANEDIFNIDSAVTTNGFAINGCVFDIQSFGGDIFDPASLDKTDIRFTFNGNTNLQDSTVNTDMHFGNNSDATVIDSSDQFVEINATWVTLNEERTSVVLNKRIKYTGLEDVSVLALPRLTVETAVGTNQTVAAYLVRLCCESNSITFDNTTDTIAKTDHGLEDDDTVVFLNSGGALPSEVRDDAVYHVINKTANNFQISNTSGGGALNFTDDGTGTHSYKRAGIAMFSKSKSIIIINKPLEIQPTEQLELVTNDEIMLVIVNETSSNNITITDAAFLLTKT